MSLTKRLAQGVLWAQVGRAAETALALVLSVVVIRRLGPESYGEYGLLLGLIGFGLLLSSLGFPEILGKHAPRLASEGRLDGIRFLLRWTLAWRTGLTLLVIAMFWVLAEPIARLFHLPHLGALRGALVLLFLSQNLHGLLMAFFSATLKMTHALVTNLVLWSASLGLTVALFEVLGVSVEAVLWASVIASALAFLVGLVLVRSWLLGGHSTLPTRPLWRFGSTIWLTGFASFGLGSQTDVLFMGYLLPDQAQIGLYRAAVMPVERAMGLLFGAWAGLTMPVLSESHAAHGASGVQRAWTGYIKLMSFLAVPALVLLGALARPLLVLLYSDQFAYSAYLLQLYVLLSLVGFAVGHGLSTVLLQTLNRERLALYFRIGAALVNVLLNILLIPRWGAAGALVGTALSGFLLWVVETVVVMRQYALRYPWVFLGKIVAAALAAAVVARLVPVEGWLGLCVGGAAFGLVFVGLCYLAKPLNQQDKDVLVAIAPRLERLIGLL